MLENLRKMEPFPAEEEKRITKRLRMIVLILAALVLVFVVWSIVNKKDLTIAYYVIVIVFLLCNWTLTEAAPVFLARALAGRTRKQASSYLKAAAFGLLSNAGLGWFLFSRNNQSIYGALLYLLGVNFARKQREGYYSEEEEDEEEASGSLPEKTEEAAVSQPLPTAADRLRRLNEKLAKEESSAMESAEESTEESDGSV